MRGACWVLGDISWHRYSGTATHEGDERASTTETRARAMHDKGEALRVGVTNETIGNRQLAFIAIHSVHSCFAWLPCLRWVA